jgi:uncharacterized protein YkwD
MALLKGSNPVWCVLLLLGVAVWQPVVATDAFAAAIADGVFERLQEARVAAEVTEFDRRAELDTIARERAVEIAGLPHASRMSAAEPIGAALDRAGLKRYLRYSLYQDMNRGYTDPTAGFCKNWRKYEQHWRNAMNPEFDAIGIASAKGEDMWRILVVVLLSDQALEPEASLEEKVVLAINDIRRQHTLAPLALDPRLVEVARGHSRDMADHDYFSHESLAGDTVGDRMTRASVSYEAVAENLQMSRGIRDPVQVAVDEWMKSPGHRTNILDPNFKRTGIGVAVTEAGAVYFTQVFLAPQILPDP